MYYIAEYVTNLLHILPIRYTLHSKQKKSNFSVQANGYTLHIRYIQYCSKCNCTYFIHKSNKIDFSSYKKHKNILILYMFCNTLYAMI